MNKTINENNNLAPILEKTVNWKHRIKVDEVSKYWERTIGRDLEEDETVRLTGVVSPFEIDGKVSTTMTIENQIRTSSELIELLTKGYQKTRDDLKTHIGLSMGSAVFKYDPSKRPGLNTFKSIKTMVIDLDAYQNKDGKGRAFFNSYDLNSRKFAAIKMLIIINEYLQKKEFDFRLLPKHVYSTGGGLQFVIDLDRDLLKDDATSLFNIIKTIFNNMAQDNGGKRFELSMFNEFSLTAETIYMEIDGTFADITHTQRVGGLVNPKSMYNGAFSEEILGFDKAGVADNIEWYVNRYKNMAETQRTDINLQMKIINKIQLHLELYSNILVFFNQKNIEPGVIKCNSIITGAKTVQVMKESIREGNETIFNSPVIKEILKKIPNQDQLDYMSKDLISIDDSFSSLFLAFKCPFHEDNKVSFVIYKNMTETDSKGNPRYSPIAKDFHDGKTYNLITFLMALNDITQAQAIQTVALEFGVELTKSEHKDYMKEMTNETVTELIDKVDTENMVYYQLAENNRRCRTRSLIDGESWNFDGASSLSDHVLTVQLGIEQADQELKRAFQIKFEERILINAFEEFRPGEDTIFNRQGHQMINLWIPSEEYKSVHKLAETMTETDIPNSLRRIKEETPNMWFFINQITQKGNIQYFFNWMVCCAKFKVMPSIPIITSVQGSGKGVFLEHIMMYYLNANYVKTITSEKIQSNFNHFMEESSLIALDEGDFSRTQEVDNLKFISGNNYMQIEKKGVDSVQKLKKFNMIILTNGDVPLRHPNSDRRISYFRLDVPLLNSVYEFGYSSIDEYLIEMKKELERFWAIAVSTKIENKWLNSNIRDNQFNRQILMMHPFGKLVIMMLSDEWDDIQLQINENVSDDTVISSNIELVNTIRQSFEATGSIKLSMINRYMQSLPFKTFTSIQSFIKSNELHKHGISIESKMSNISIKIEVNKLKSLIHMDSNLGNVMDCYSPSNYEKTLQDAKNLTLMDEEIISDTVDTEGLHISAKVDPFSAIPQPLDINELLL
jgi:hypothetical protein